SIAKNFVKKILRDNPAANDVTGSFSSSSLASRITKLYDLHGGAFTVDGGFVSSLIAVDYSLQKLRRGESSFGICIGAYRWTNSHAFEFYQSKYENMQFPLAEGAGAIVLKSLEQVDKATEKPIGLIYDLIRVVDGKVDKSAWSSLNLAIDDLMFVSIASPIPSKQLCKLEEFFRNEKRTRPIPITTCREQFGNLCAGAGMAELIKTLVILQDQEIPPQFDEQDESQSNETSIFFVTKNKLTLELDEHSFAISFDLDESGNGYAAVVLPFIVAQNKVEDVTDITADIIKARPIQKANLSRSFDMGLASVEEVPKRVCVYRQIGTSYDLGFGLGVADAAGIASMIQACDKIPQWKESDEAIGFDELLSRGREIFGESGIDEMRGLSDGSGIPFEKLFLHNIRFYSGLRGAQFLLRDAGIFKHVIIFEHSIREFIGDKLDIHLSECEPATSEAYLRVSATGCVGAFAAIRAEISVSILPKQQQPQSQPQNIADKIQLTQNSNLTPFVNIADFLNKTANITNILPANPTTDFLIVDTLKGNFTNSTPIPEHNLKTTQNLIQKFSSNPQYFCTIMLRHNSIEIF
ncbi:MAG: hypothetical protein LBL39_04365, partial [Planctomycetaceae bacterium]|nr:hypothetical protein [Planctomycetaceae bacterium]